MPNTRSVFTTHRSKEDSCSSFIDKLMLLTACCPVIFAAGCDDGEFGEGDNGYLAHEESEHDSNPGLALEAEEFPGQDLEATDAATDLTSDPSNKLSRREAYERFGIIPPVPASVSPDPKDPRFVFGGYVDVNREMPVTPPPFKEMGPDERAKLNQRAKVGEIFLTIIVPDLDEMWHWKMTKKLHDEITALREQEGGSLSDPPENPLGGEDDPEESALFGSDNILGSDDRVLRGSRNGNNMTAYPWTAMGSLVVDGWNEPRLPRCSTSKIGPRLLITAGHCVYDPDNNRATYVDWYPGADGTSTGDASPNGRRGVELYIVEYYWQHNGWLSRDWALLVLYDSLTNVNFGALGWKEDYSLVGTPLWMFGYPCNGKTCEASPYSDKNCGGSMYGHEKSVIRTEIPYIFTHHDVQECQSGAPVYEYMSGNRYVVGHLSSTYVTENRSIKIYDALADDIKAAKKNYPSNYYP